MAAIDRQEFGHRDAPWGYGEFVRIKVYAMCMPDSKALKYIDIFLRIAAKMKSAYRLSMPEDE
jgi:hypothetical protein